MVIVLVLDLASGHEHDDQERLGHSGSSFDRRRTKM